MAQVLTPVPVAVAARADRVLLTSTGTTTVLAWTPNRTQAVEVAVYVAVAGSNTALTLVVAWTDPEVGAAQYTYYNAQTLTAGVPALQPVLLVVAQGGQPITLTAQAGTANTVTITAEYRARR